MKVEERSREWETNKKKARNLNSSVLWHSDKKPELGIRRSGLEIQF